MQRPYGLRRSDVHCGNGITFKTRYDYEEASCLPAGFLLHHSRDLCPVATDTRQVENGVEIRVQDNGPGIPKKIKGKIFEPFFTTKPAGSGTGLGLSLAYDIVTQGYGGAMTVESEEGQGATFVITLPDL